MTDAGLKVWLNGRILLAEDARLSVFDHGFLYGHGVFETMRAYSGQVFLLREHLQRLRASASLLRIPLDLSDDAAARAIASLLRENRLADAYVRLTVSRGPGPIGMRGAFGAPSVLIFAKPLALPPAEAYAQGRDLCILQTRRNTPETGVRVKSLNFLNSLAGAWEAADRGYAEGMMLDGEGHIAEGTVSNLFFAERERLWTPSLDTGILPGVTRAYVIRLAHELGIAVAEARFGVERLADFTEAFTTNSLTEIVPVRSVDGHVFPLCPGPLTRRLMEAYARRRDGEKGELQDGV
ncbi:aminotransferase class IV [Effusibacillus pohliae]|uniref:aminotransferase class IV n=1 Tax=Effusibacillus pohliae TaxID=232270 RepID=UPI0003615AA0|nr:aminotransferase class IV [Effusibacillus pohliae]